MTGYFHRLKGHLGNLRTRLREEVKYINFKRNCHLINEIKRPQLTEDDVVVVCRVRNGYVYLEEFLRHYNALGVRHFAFIDNGSNDKTVQYLSEANNVSVYQTNFDYEKYKRQMSRFLVESFGTNNWVLAVDIDELFDYPHSRSLSLSKIISYLNKKNYNAVVAQMLDMFPREGLSENSMNWKSTHIYFDISSAERHSYTDFYGENNAISNENMSYFIGGIRSAAFGSRSWMTKHPLIKPSSGVKIENDHHVKFGSVADFSCVLLHYKYVGNFLEYVRDVVERGAMFNDSVHYKKYLAKLEQDPNMSLYSSSSEKFESAEQLLQSGYLLISDDFTEELLS